MIEFKKKNYTIPEGHYTGPKDREKLPGVLEMVGKSALGGAVLGGIVGKIRKDSTILKDAWSGTKYGALAGIALKLFLNHLHKPMSKVKYNEVDKNIRREFGIYKIADLTIGDSIDKRASMEERISFNNRKIADFKINICVAHDEVTMYTLNLTDYELDKLSDILDYYCKQYWGMNYDSILINKKTNSYSIRIVFTNYQVISNFINEVSSVLETKINILNSDALVKGTLIYRKEEEPSIEENQIEEKIEEEKTFSFFPSLSKRDLVDIFCNVKDIPTNVDFRKYPKLGASFAILQLINNTLKKLGVKNIIKETDRPVPRTEYNSLFLEATLDKLGLINGFDYTIDNEKATTNLSLIDGLLVLTANTNTSDYKEIEKLAEKYKSLINKSIIDNEVCVFSAIIRSREDLNYILKGLQSSGIIFNLIKK